MKFLICLLFAFSISASADDLPEKQGLVVDQAQLFSLSEKSELAQVIGQFTSRGGVNFHVLTLKDLGEKDFQTYTEDVTKKWFDESEDRFFLLAVAMEQRKLRLEVGPGLKNRIGEAQTSQLVQVIGTYFKKAKYTQGVSYALTSLEHSLGMSIQVQAQPVKQYSAPPPVQTSSSLSVTGLVNKLKKKKWEYYYLGGHFLFFLLFIFLGARLRGGKGLVYSPDKGWSTKRGKNTQIASGASGKW